MIAQQLYEGIELPGEGAVGLITYMRTDSTRVADQALTDVREFIGQKFGPDYAAGEAELLSSQGRRAGRARSHPSDVDAVPPGRSAGHLTPDQYYLYRLIWNRFVASQMPPATFDETTVDVEASKYLFRVKGSVPKFAGWMAVYNQEPAEERTAGPGPRRGKRRRRRRRQRAAAAERRRSARAARAQAGAEVHAAAAALQ